MVGRRAYDLMYRWWAPWDAVGFRDELRQLLDTGEVTPRTHPRVIDLGCGTGANVVELATRGYDATGVDFSPVALEKARARARTAGVDDRCRFLEVDLTAPTLPAEVGTGFDLVLDFGTLDDLGPAGRTQMAAHEAQLTRPGGLALFWCFYAAKRDLPRMSFNGPSRFAPAIEPGEEQRLFGAAFTIEPFARPLPHAACFLLRRTSSSADGSRTYSGSTP